MKIISAEHLNPSPTVEGCPRHDKPEIVMVGRSNVGKSSLINCMVQRKKLAFTSNTPGKTRLIHFYEVNRALILVDLPGYGYAKVSKTMQEDWQRELSRYLSERQNICTTLLILDARHDPKPQDFDMWQWLWQHKHWVTFVLTKVDQIKPAELQKRIKILEKQFHAHPSEIIPFSSKTGLGRDALWALIQQRIQPTA
jgi:GTP-binding protein